MAAQPRRGLDATPGDPRGDPSPSQVAPVGAAVVALVRVDRAGPGAAPSRGRADRRQVVHNRLEHGGVVDVGGGHHRGKRQPGTVADQVELGPGLAPVDRVCAHKSPALGAQAKRVDRHARPVQRPRRPSSSSSSRCSRSNTPASAHSANRRQHVAGEPQPSSRVGSSRHGVEVRAMNTIAAKQARSGIARRRPPYGGRGGPVARAPPAPIACPARGRQPVLSWRGIMPDRPKGAKRRLRARFRPLSGSCCSPRSHA
jgi:hypothetical protein